MKRSHTVLFIALNSLLSSIAFAGNATAIASSHIALPVAQDQIGTFVGQEDRYPNQPCTVKISQRMDAQHQAVLDFSVQMLNGNQKEFKNVLASAVDRKIISDTLARKSAYKSKWNAEKMWDWIDSVSFSITKTVSKAQTDQGFPVSASHVTIRGIFSQQNLISQVQIIDEVDGSAFLGVNTEDRLICQGLVRQN